MISSFNLFNLQTHEQRWRNQTSSEMGGSMKQIYLNLIISITAITILNNKYLVQTEQINGTIAVTQPNNNNKNLTCEDGYCNVDLGDTNWINKYASSSGKEVEQRQQKQHPQSVMNDEYLRQSSIIFGLTKTATYDTLNSLCYKQMKEIERAILRKDVWAMKGKFSIRKIYTWWRCFSAVTKCCLIWVESFVSCCTSRYDLIDISNWN